MQGEFIIPFNPDGSVSENYVINTKVLNADININSDLKINNLSTDIKYIFKSNKEKEINFFINKGKILNLDLKQSAININFKDDKRVIKSKIKTVGNSKYSEIKKIASLLKLNLNNIKNIELTSDLETSLNFLLDKRFKITDREFIVKGKINDLNLEHSEIKNIKTFLPSYTSKIILKDVEVSLDHINNFNLSGLVKFDKNFEGFVVKHSGLSDENFRIDGKINLKDLFLKIPNLNYFKEKNIKADLDFYIMGQKSGYEISRLLYSSGKSKIELDKVRLNKKLEIKDVVSIKVKTFKNNIKNNDFHIGKDEKFKNTIFILGELFDAEPLLKSLYKKNNDKKTLSDDFNTEIRANLDKAITGANDDISNFSMIASIKKGDYMKLSLKGNFSQNEIVEMSVYQVDPNKKTLHLISDRARPFIRNFDFIKGFEGGKLEYESTIYRK